MKTKTSGFVVCAILFGFCSFAAAQQPQAKVSRIGILRPGTAPDGFLDIFIQKLRDLGYIEGKNIYTEVRFAAETWDILRILQRSWSG